jgi:NAD(P)-dependent dehydrogenase (short-subunit alcohol dehydrogenase family)
VPRSQQSDYWRACLGGDRRPDRSACTDPTASSSKPRLVSPPPRKGLPNEYRPAGTVNSDHGWRSRPWRSDSADPEQFAQLFSAIDQQFGRIDVLVNNAAIVARQSRLEDLEFERIRRLFAVNSIGPILCAQQAVKRTSDRHNGRGGAVINVSSASARLGSPNEYVDYAASKGAVETFTTGFAKEVARIKRVVAAPRESGFGRS